MILMPTAAIGGTTINTTFTYDLNGNHTAGLGRSISYTSYNKPSWITQGSSTLFFSDDFDHQRFKQTAPEGITLYLSAFGVRAELFSSAVSQWTDYLSVGGATIGMRVLHSDEFGLDPLFPHRSPRFDRRQHQRNRRRGGARFV